MSHKHDKNSISPRNVRYIGHCSAVLACALLLTGCAQKIVTIPGPEVVRLVPAKVDPRLLTCMDVDPPDVDLIREDTPPSKVAAILGVVAHRYRLAWLDCRAKLKAIEDIQQ